MAENSVWVWVSTVPKGRHPSCCNEVCMAPCSVGLPAIPTMIAEMAVAVARNLLASAPPHFRDESDACNGAQDIVRTYIVKTMKQWMK